MFSEEVLIFMKGFNLKLTAAIVTSLFASSLHAQEVAQLETVEAVNERIYDAIATEKTRDYSSFASTVGTKRPAALREIPQSITVITNQQVQDRSVNTLDQLAAQVPGLRVLANDDGRSSVYARGYEYSEYNIDGLPAQMASIMGTLPNLIAFDRVEIMRGPSGLFDSSGEMGGIINFVRKRPTKTLSGSIGAGYGTAKRYDVDADISGPLNASGSLRGRLIAQTNGVSYKPAEKNNRNSTLYAALDWDVTPSTTFGLGYLYQRRDLAPDNGYPTYADGALLPLPQHDYVGADWNKFHSESHDFFADLKHYFDNGGHAKIGMRYSDRKADFNYIFAGSALNAKNQTTASGSARDLTQKSFAIDASYSQPFNIGKTQNDFVVGADYNQFETEDASGRYSTAAKTKVGKNGEKIIVQPAQYFSLFSLRSYPYQDILGNATPSKSKQSEAGVYGKLVFRPIDSLSVIVGGRVGHYDIKNYDVSIGAKPLGDKSRTGTTLTGYGGLVFDFLPNQSLYASYSMLHIPQSDIDINGNMIKPRKGTQIEGGYKGSFNNDALNVRLSVYQLKDQNAAAKSAIDTNYAVALGKRKIRGFEAEVSGNITDKWRIHAGYSYIDTKVEVAGSGNTDAIFNLMPRHSGNIWTTYDVTEKFTVGAGMNAMSKMHFVAAGGKVITGPGYATYDLMAAYAFTPKFKVQVNVNNVFNRHYYARVGQLHTFNIPGKERNIYVSARYSF